MFVFKMLLLIFGIIYLLFGFLIKIQKRYSLIMGYSKDSLKINDKYCDKIGLGLLIDGLFSIILGILSFFLIDVVTIIFFVCMMVVTIGCLYLTQFSFKNKN